MDNFRTKAKAWLAEETQKRKTKATSSSQFQSKPKAAPRRNLAKKKSVAAKVKEKERNLEGHTQSSDVEEENNRSAVFRNGPSFKATEKKHRALSQRMMLVSRERGTDTDTPGISSSSQATLKEIFKVLGSTGNVYTVIIDDNPSCDCPDARKHKNEVCKHLIFVFLKVLKLPQTDHAWYQKSLLASEVIDIFAKAKPDPTLTNARLQSAYLVATGQESTTVLVPSESSTSGRRNVPQLGSDSLCPICYEDFTPGETKGLIFCESSCGNPVHDQCFKQWRNACSSSEITCVWCRANLSMENNPLPAVPSQVHEYGMQYLNLANEGGINSIRDYSTYSGSSLLGLYVNGTLSREEVTAYNRRH